MSTDTARKGTIDMHAVCERIRAAGYYAYVEYTGGGCATIYASLDENPERPGMPSMSHFYTCAAHDHAHDPGAQAVAGPGWFEGTPERPFEHAYGDLADFYVGPDDQGDERPYAATARDTEASIAARLITTMIDQAQHEVPLTLPTDPCAVCDHAYNEHAFDNHGPLPLCHAQPGGVHCFCRGYIAQEDES